MKSRMFIISMFTLLAFLSGSIPVSAESNWAEQFLSRYRPSAINAAASAQTPQEIAQMIRNGQLPLTEADVINLILANNLDIGLNRLTPLSTQYLLESLYKPFEPTLQISADVSRNTAPATTQLSGAPSVSSLSHSYSVGFLQTLASGTDLAVSVGMNRSSTNSFLASFNPSWTGIVKYQFTQHVLKNFGRSVNLHDIHVAQNNQDISDIEFEKEVMDLVAQAQKMYWGLVFDAEDIKVKQRSMELAQKTLSDNQIQVNIGTMAPIDLIQAESEVATRRQALVVSTYTQVQNEDQVKKVITNQADPGMVLARLIPMQPVRQPAPGDVPSVEEAIRIALENRPEMRQYQLELKNTQLDADYAKNQLLPTVDINGSYVQNGVGGTKRISPSFGAPPTQIIPGGLGDAFQQLFGYDFTGYTLGVSVQIPLRNRAAQANQARAETQKRISENKLATTAQQIALEVRNALTAVDMTRTQIETAQKARELAERRLEAEQKKFDLGASTIRFVLEEQRNVAQAQTDEVSALVGYTQALVDFDHAVGMTLKKNNIQVDKTLNPTTAPRQGSSN